MANVGTKSALVRTKRLSKVLLALVIADVLLWVIATIDDARISSREKELFQLQMREMTRPPGFPRFEFYQNRSTVDDLLSALRNVGDFWFNPVALAFRLGGHATTSEGLRIMHENPSQSAMLYGGRAAMFAGLVVGWVFARKRSNDVGSAGSAGLPRD